MPSETAFADPSMPCFALPFSSSAVSRAYGRLLKVARTIADLGGVDDIQVAHVAEAIQSRALDSKFWRM